MPLFKSTPIIEPKSISELYQQLRNLDERLKVLDKNFKKEGMFSRKESDSIMLSQLSFDEDIKEIKESIAKIKRKMKVLRTELHYIINDLKQIVTINEFERFKERVDLWAPEKFLTKEEVDKLMRTLLSS
ncbi:hypothetical protein D6745_00310 [Candidatus Woesearchaeota archaeon]|nr:MAG: hypothetical protein D6745_00310 [Candidatus Woesearchaeota archaeon]